MLSLMQKPVKNNRRRAQRGRRQLGSRRQINPFLSARARPSTVVLRDGQLVPDKMIVPMKYVQTIQLTGGTGFASYVFSQNSVYDPNVTSTGGSVVGFTPYAQLYSRYRVLSSSIRCTFQTTDEVAISVALAPAITDLGTSQTAEVVASLKHARPHILRFLPVAGGGQPTVLNDQIATARLQGESLYDEQNLFGIGSTDPVTQFYWAIGTSCITEPAYSVNITVELEYSTEWSQARDFGL